MILDDNQTPELAVMRRSPFTSSPVLEISRTPPESTTCTPSPET
jgi:hypothetical protein